MVLMAWLAPWVLVTADVVLLVLLGRRLTIMLVFLPVNRTVTVWLTFELLLATSVCPLAR